MEKNKRGRKEEEGKEKKEKKRKERNEHQGGGVRIRWESSEEKIVNINLMVMKKIIMRMREYGMVHMRKEWGRFHTKVARRTWQMTGGKWDGDFRPGWHVARVTRLPRRHQRRLMVKTIWCAARHHTIGGWRCYWCPKLFCDNYLSLRGIKWRLLEQNERQLVSIPWKYL